MSETTVTLEQALRIADEHFRHGRLAEAESVSRQVLAAFPEQADALHQLAMIACESGANEPAEDFAQRAIAANPNGPWYYNTLGLVLYRQSRCEEAASAYRAALRLAPEFATAFFNLANALRGLGARHEALAAYREAIRLQPASAEIHNNLGALLGDLGDLSGAIAAYRTSIQLNPRDPLAYNNLGHTLLITGDGSGSVTACQTALALDPRFANAHLNLGNAMALQGKFVEAIAAYRAAIQCEPTLPDAHCNLGNALKDSGLAGEAIPHYREALRLAPGNPISRSNFIYSLQFDATSDPALVTAEQALWNEQHVCPLRTQTRPHENDRSPDRRLKIGYVSPDFCSHAVSFFLLPLLRAHDHAQVEIHAYASVPRPDAITAKMRAATDVWHDVLGVSDTELAEQIRTERIDILIDLTMHSASNRLPLFALKPAPVQASWLAYPGQTGLETIDWRVTDSNLEPATNADNRGSEQALRLADLWCCYDPLDSFPPVSVLPAATAGHVTFGSMNSFSKISPVILDCWARLLKTVPTARLTMVCPEGSCRDRIHAAFAKHGVENARLELLAPLAWEDYVRFGERVDLCLDPFPCNGMTTTCHALWMGLPIVSLAGPLPASRSGLTLLSTIGLPELVTHSEEEYIRVAAELAGDIPRLAQLRATLRQRMQASPLMDAPGFARKMEAAYRTMWRRWCG